jgi:excinuclease ABC subunit B
MAESLTEYYREAGIRVRYLHSDIDTIERTEIIRELRVGVFDVLVGVNLLREGLDLPEVSLVAILDADKEGFLRSSRSLIQTVGRAARNIRGRVFFFADTVTDSIRQAMDETDRRREIQREYNRRHGITPRSISKQIRRILDSVYEKDYVDVGSATDKRPSEVRELSRDEMAERVKAARAEMARAARNLEFERAAELRDEIRALETRLLEI